MLTNILNTFLSESAVLGYNDIEDVEPSTEGFDHESGGTFRANMLAEAAFAELDAVVTATEVKGYQQLAEGATIEEMLVLQEGVVTNIISKAKEIIKKLWSRMKSVANSVKLQFEKVFNSKAFVVDAEKTLKSITDFTDLELEGYVYTLDAIDPKAGASKAFNEINASVKSTVSVIDGVDYKGKTLEAYNTALSSKIKPLMEKLEGETLKNSVCNAIVGVNEDSVNEEIFKKLRDGKDSKDTVSWNKEKCLAAIKNMSSLSNKIKSISGDIDTMYKAALSIINDLEKLTNKAKSGDISDVKRHGLNEISKVLSKGAEGLKYALGIANRVVDGKFQAIKEEASQSKSFIMKAISQGKKNARAAEKVSESTDVTNFLDGILAKY